jgi:hypothetical protein
MAYKLTLTKGERDAIDWVGGRYAHGTDFYKLLCECTASPDDADWDDERDITYTVPEHVAWQMADIINGEDRLACFSGEFCEKLLTFAGRIV